MLGKVGHSLIVWQARCLQPDGDRWSPEVCWGYLVGAWISCYQSRRRSGRCGSGKKQLTLDQLMLEILGLRPKSVGGVWFGPVSVHDIWSVSMSVEDVDAPTKVPGEI